VVVHKIAETFDIELISNTDIEYNTEHLPEIQFFFTEKSPRLSSSAFPNSSTELPSMVFSNTA
jgi:hypothetical protein